MGIPACPEVKEYFAIEELLKEIMPADVVRRHWHIENGFHRARMLYSGKTGSGPKKKKEYIILD